MTNPGVVVSIDFDFSPEDVEAILRLGQPREGDSVRELLTDFARGMVDVSLDVARSVAEERR